MSTLDQLLSMGFPQDLAQAVSYKFPRDLDRAADYCICPPADWEATLKQDMGLWDPPPNKVPSVGWDDTQEDPQTRSMALTRVQDAPSQPQSQSSTPFRRQSPPPSRPEPLPSYTPAQNSSSEQSASDAELASALALSMAGPQEWNQSNSTSTAATGLDFYREGATAGWSQSTGSWSHSENAPSASTSKTSVQKLKDQSKSYLHYEPSEVRSSDTPVHFAAPSRHLSPLATLLQVLYATTPFRDAILSIELPYTDQELSYEGYITGDNLTLPPDQVNPTQAQQMQILKAIQRLFVYASHTRRRIVPIFDISAVFADQAYHPDHLDQWPKPDIALSALKNITDAWKNVAPPEQANLITTKGRTGPSTAAPITLTPASFQEDADEATTTELPLEVTDSTKSLYEALEKTLNGAGGWVVDLPDVLLITLDRRALEQRQSRVLKISETLEMARFLWSNSEDVVERAKKRESLVESQKELQSERDQIKLHEGKDYVTMLKTALKYFETQAISQDENHKARQENLKTHFRALLTSTEAKLAEKDVQLSAIENAMTSTFDMPVDPASTYTLQGVASSTGLPAGDMCFAYVRYGQGWFKTLDTRVEASILDDVIADESGSWVGAGPYFLCYSREKGTAASLAKSSQALVDAVDRDNASMDQESSGGSMALPAEVNPQDVPLPPPSEGMQLDSAAATPTSQLAPQSQSDTDDDVVLVQR